MRHIAGCIRLSALAGLAWFLAAPPVRAADPTTEECLTANNSSIDLRNRHKLLAARAQLLICASASCPSDIRQECLRHVDEVSAEIPTIVFHVKDAEGRDMIGVKVTMDERPLTERLEGTALSVDPGEHRFVFEAAGQTAVHRQIVIVQSEKGRREEITFGGRVGPVAPTPSPPPPGLGAQKTLAIVSAAVGVVGVGVGSAFGGIMLSQKSEAQTACPDRCRDQRGVDLWNRAVSSGNIATAFFVVGGLGAAAGAVLWITAPPRRAPAVEVGLGPGALQLKGTW